MNLTVIERMFRIYRLQSPLRLCARAQRIFESATPRTTSHQLHLLQARLSRRKMSSDADYAAFLDKANEDSSAAKTSSKQNQSSDNGFKTLKTSDAQIPSTLSGGVKDHTYTSDSDEPFEAVAYKSSGKELNECMYCLHPLQVIARYVDFCHSAPV